MALQFKFNCGVYPIVQLLPLKQPTDSQYIQASSLKSISVPNVKGVFHIHTSRQNATFTKMLKWGFGWQYECGCLPLHMKI